MPRPRRRFHGRGPHPSAAPRAAPRSCRWGRGSGDATAHPHPQLHPSPDSSPMVGLPPPQHPAPASEATRTGFDLHSLISNRCGGVGPLVSLLCSAPLSSAENLWWVPHAHWANPPFLALILLTPAASPSKHSWPLYQPQLHLAATLNS